MTFSDHIDTLISLETDPPSRMEYSGDIAPHSGQTAPPSMLVFRERVCMTKLQFFSLAFIFQITVF
jgi:hypothetical protein